MKLIAYVEDHTGVRNSISGLLMKTISHCIVYGYENGFDFTTRFPKEGYTPDIVLMDIRMTPMNGYETTKWLKKNYPSIPVLAFSDVVDKEAIVEVSRCGANGCTEKNNAALGKLPEIIERIISGEKHYDTVEIHKLVNKLLNLDRKNINEGFSALSDKEVEVLKLATSPLSEVDKAKKLHISKATLAKHTSNIYKKLNINKSSIMSALAYKLGLTEK